MSGVNWPIYAHDGPIMLAQAHLAAVPVRRYPHQSWCFGHCSSIITHTSFGVLATVPGSSPTPVLVCQPSLRHHPHQSGCVGQFLSHHPHQSWGVCNCPLSSPTPVLVCLQLPCVITHANLSESAPVEYLQHHPVLVL